MFRLDLYRRAGEVETEFMTVMWFANHEAIVRFAGPDWETAVVPASARAMLSRFEEKAAHYELRVAQEAAPHSDRTRTNERWPHGDVLLHLANG